MWLLVTACSGCPLQGGSCFRQSHPHNTRRVTADGWINYTAASISCSSSCTSSNTSADQQECCIPVTASLCHTAAGNFTDHSRNQTVGTSLLTDKGSFSLCDPTTTKQCFDCCSWANLQCMPCSVSGVDQHGGGGGAQFKLCSQLTTQRCAGCQHYTTDRNTEMWRLPAQQNRLNLSLVHPLAHL